MSFKDTSFNKDFGLLIEGGFLAVKQGDQNAAERLFRAAQVLDPVHTAPLLGFGYIALHSMNLKLARAYFEDVLNKEPSNAWAKVLLGFCLILPKASFKITTHIQIKEEDLRTWADMGASLIRDALSSSDDSSVKLLGEAALELSEKADKYQQTPLTSTISKR